MSSEPSDPLQGRLEFAVEIARQAGQQTLSLFGSAGLKVDCKADGSPVTVADQQAEQLLRERIGEQFPKDAILGEEYGESPGTSGFRWVLDPIDGTKSFVTGVPLYTTLVAVLQDETPQIGVIFAPAAAEMVYAGRGLGCWHIAAEQQPTRASVSEVSELSEAVLLTSSVREFSTARETNGRPFYDRLESVCRMTRTWGDAFGYLLVATGRAEIMIDPIMNLWDAAALQPVIEEAGGRFFDWKGTPTVHSGESIATNGQLVEQVLAQLRGEP